MDAAQTTRPMINDKREIFGWAMYDWANSAFSTTVGTVFLGPYLSHLATVAAESSPDGLVRLLGIGIAPGSFFPYCISLSVGLQVLYPALSGRHGRLFSPAQADDAVVCHHRRGYHHSDVLQHPGYLVAGRPAFYHCQPGLWGSNRFLQFLPAGYCQRGSARPGQLLRLGHGLPGRWSAPGPEPGLLYLQR